MHWGYWPAPRRALLSDADFAIAAERLTQEICALADLADGHLVLDVGCGFGGTIAFLNERFDAMQLLGVNIDPRQLDRAKRLVLPLKHNTIAFQEGDACALPFPDASFDRVLAVECIFHFPSRETFFQEACRVLKPGGLLTLSDFLPSKAFAPFCRPRKPGRHNAFGSIDVEYTLSRYRALAKRTGLVSEAERDIGRNTLPTYRYLQRMLRTAIVSKRDGFIVCRLLGLQWLLGATGLLNYTLLSFRKP